MTFDFTTTWNQREKWHASGYTDTYRLYHGYEEGVSGLTIDRYGEDIIVNSKVDLGDEILCEIREFLLAHGQWRSIIVKMHQSVKSPRGARIKNLLDSEIPKFGIATENEVKYFVDLSSLHSNGFYIDTRPVRKWLKDNTAGRRVLNLFSHTGSLGLISEIGGAKEVVHVDNGKRAIENTKLSYSLNNLKFDSRSFVRGDIYYHLPKAIKSNQKFSGIILDPPPNIHPPPHRPKHRPKGQDFETLVAMSAKLLDKDSWIICVFHDFHFSHEQHEQMVIDFAKPSCELSPIWRCISDDDFPESDSNRKLRATVFKTPN